jgi:hypothetical protein
VKLKLQLNVTQLFYLAKQEEGEVIKKWKASIIIHGLKDLTEANPAKREESDKDKIVSMLQ